jgi:hypothetical protein
MLDTVRVSMHCNFSEVDIEISHLHINMLRYYLHIVQQFQHFLLNHCTSDAIGCCVCPHRLSDSRGTPGYC